MTQTINIEVRISQELRDLVAGQHLMTAHPAVDPDQAGPEGQSTLPEDDGPDWVPVCLRRDGDRPCQFRGVPLVSFTGQIALVEMSCDQNVDLYQSEDGAVYLALALHMPSAAATRPVYDCLEVETGHWDVALARWFSRIRAHTPVTQPDPQRNVAPLDLPVIAGRFHALTAHCFRAA